MGAKSSGPKLSKDQQKLHSYYVPNVNEKKLNVIEKQARSLKIKYTYRAFIVGFLLEYCLGVSSIYDKANRRTTMRRLNAKRKQDIELGLKLQNEGSSGVAKSE